MSSELQSLVKDFLKNSKASVAAIVGKLQTSMDDRRSEVYTPSYFSEKASEASTKKRHLYLRSSIEYSNPQLTIEEVQGILAARLLEVCGNHFDRCEIEEVDEDDVKEICEMLHRPPSGKIVPFLLNTDDVEPDRYSSNPLRESLVESGQSAYPSNSVKTEGLKIDRIFMHKYEGVLITREEAEMIENHLQNYFNYVDMVDAVKHQQLRNISEVIGIHLILPYIRMPLSVLEREQNDGLLHYLIKGSHSSFETIKQIYNLMSRSIKKRRTLLTVPHSEKGYASKRSARGRIYFDGSKLRSVKVVYRTTRLYENDVDPSDVSFAKAEDNFTVSGARLIDYTFNETPSSPQFILYSLASPEDAAIWHGIGVHGASQLVKSYTTTRLNSANGLIFEDFKNKYRYVPSTPLQFNLIPEDMWAHPIHKNIDASVGCVGDIGSLFRLGMKIKCLSTNDYLRGA